MPERDESPRAAAKAKAIADMKAAQKTAADERAAAEEEAEPVMEGYDDTLPGQTEIVAGSAAHVRELSAYPNASSYGPDVNVVVPPDVPEGGVAGAPTVVDVPYVSQADVTLTCTMGNWTGEPTSYVYEWFFDGVSAGVGGATCTVGADEVGQSATCVVSATNAAGTTAAPPSNAVVVM